MKNQKTSSPSDRVLSPRKLEHLPVVGLMVVQAPLRTVPRWRVAKGWTHQVSTKALSLPLTRTEARLPRQSMNRRLRRRLKQLAYLQRHHREFRIPLQSWWRRGRLRQTQAKIANKAATRGINRCKDPENCFSISMATGKTWEWVTSSWAASSEGSMSVSWPWSTPAMDCLGMKIKTLTSFFRMP